MIAFILMTGSDRDKRSGQNEDARGREGKDRIEEAEENEKTE